MPRTKTECELFMSHRGVDVFHTYKNDDVDQGRRTYWYTTDVYGSEDGTQAFDVRSVVSALLERVDHKHEKYDYEDSDSHKKIIEDAIDCGLIKDGVDE